MSVCSMWYLFSLYGPAIGMFCFEGFRRRLLPAKPNNFKNHPCLIIILHLLYNEYTLALGIAFMRKFLASLLEVVEIAVIAVAAVFIVRTFFVQPFLVSGT